MRHVAWLGRRVALLLALAFTALLALSAPAMAGEAFNATTEVKLDPFVVAILSGLVIPIITELLTKLGAASGVKAIVALVLSVVATVVNQIVTLNGEFVPQDMLLLFALTFVTNGSSYSHIWKPIGNTGGAPGANLLPNVGFGSPGG